MLGRPVSLSGNGDIEGRKKNMRDNNLIINKKGGITFVETLISVVLLSFLVLCILTVFHAGDNIWRSEITLSELQGDVRLAIDGITRELRRSKSSNITITGGSTIDFAITDVSGNISYYLSGSRIIREHPSGTTKILANNIDYLNFSPSSPSRNVTVAVRGAKTYRGRNYYFNLTEKIWLRND